LTVSHRDWLKGCGIDEVLARHSALRIVPSAEGILLRGQVSFHVAPEGLEPIADSYQVEIKIPGTFPKRIPSVWETGGRIPRTYHKLQDGSLCLGSRTRLQIAVTESPSILRFIDRCLIPYLYGYSFSEKHRRPPFGELAHGEAGTRDDLAVLFGTTRLDSVRVFAQLAASKKRIANKKQCPCGSGLRVGCCHNRQINRLRSLLGRAWFRRVRDSLSLDRPSQVSAA
jgi:hypothetical protein